MKTTFVGVDGWKDGWVAAVVTGRQVTWHAFAQHDRDSPRDAFGRLLDAYGDATIAVDIPIGTVEEARRSDADAAAWLHAVGAQRSSIFLTPSAELVAAYQRDPSHRSAMADARARGLPGTSIQAWNLIPKIVEVQLALDGRPDVVHRVVEAHPECSFRRLELELRDAGYAEPALGKHSKKTAVGVGLRLRLLDQVFSMPDLVDAPAGVPIDDLLDACAVAWTAQRYSAGRHVTLPAQPRAAEPRIVV